jgi:hypothetical protein
MTILPILRFHLDAVDSAVMAAAATYAAGHLSPGSVLGIFSFAPVTEANWRHRAMPGTEDMTLERPRRSLPRAPIPATVGRRELPIGTCRDVAAWSRIAGSCTNSGEHGGRGRGRSWARQHSTAVAGVSELREVARHGGRRRAGSGRGSTARRSPAPEGPPEAGRGTMVNALYELFL